MGTGVGGGREICCQSRCGERQEMTVQDFVWRQASIDAAPSDLYESHTP